MHCPLDIFHDSIKIVGQQVVAKIQRCAILGPVPSGFFICTDQQTFTFLAHIVFTIVVMNERELPAQCLDFRYAFSDQILMLHRHQGQIESGEFAHFPTP